MITFGSLIFAPFAYNWYPLLESLFPKSGGIINLIFKVGFDQTIGSCLVLTTLNFYVTLINTKGDISKAMNDCTNNLFKTLKVNWLSIYLLYYIVLYYIIS